jgi:OOP family OmpA-OmpF porin
MQKKLLAALLGAVLVVPVVAHAEGSYFKVDVGQSKYKDDSPSENETAASLAYGFAIDKNFGVEVGYINFGKLKNFVEEEPSRTYQQQAFYLAGVGSYPLTDALSATGKLGIAVNRQEWKVSEPDLIEAHTETKTRAMIGLGLAYNFTKEVAGTLEYQYFGKASEIKVSAITVGVKYGF